MNNDKEIKTMLEREQNALTIIQNHMKNLLNSKIVYKSDKKNDYPRIQAELFQSFWNECFDKYNDEIERYCMDYTELTEISSDDGSSGDDNPSGDGDPSSVSSDSENMSESDNDDEDDEADNVILMDPLEQLDEVFFSICDQIYPDPASSTKCEKLYQALYEQLKEDLSRPYAPPKANFKIRKEIFAYLPEILDLGNQDICSILPYLMTAYVCKAPTSRFFYKRKTLLELIFGNTEIESDQASKPRDNIKNFCQLFSLSQANFDFALNVDYDFPRRKVGLSAYYAPGVKLTSKDKKVLGYIFGYWCEKIPQFASENKIDIKIDANLCEELFYYYMNNDSQKTLK